MSEGGPSIPLPRVGVGFFLIFLLFMIINLLLNNFFLGPDARVLCGS